MQKCAGNNWQEWGNVIFIYSKEKRILYKSWRKS